MEKEVKEGETEDEKEAEREEERHLLASRFLKVPQPKKSFGKPMLWRMELVEMETTLMVSSLP